MTEITKPLSRRTRSPFAHYRKRIIVILETGDVIGMRFEGTRTVYRAPIDSIFRHLAQWHANSAKRRRQ